MTIELERTGEIYRLMDAGSAFHTFSTEDLESILHVILEAYLDVTPTDTNVPLSRFRDSLRLGAQSEQDDSPGVPELDDSDGPELSNWDTETYFEGIRIEESRFYSGLWICAGGLNAGGPRIASGSHERDTMLERMSELTQSFRDRNRGDQPPVILLSPDSYIMYQDVAREHGLSIIHSELTDAGYNIVANRPDATAPIGLDGIDYTVDEVTQEGREDNDRLLRQLTELTSQANDIRPGQITWDVAEETHTRANPVRSDGPRDTERDLSGRPVNRTAGD